MYADPANVLAATPFSPSDVTRKVFLAPAIDSTMATPASVEYRTAYQRHRRGGADGAVGEGVARREEHPTKLAAKGGGMRRNDRSALRLEALEHASASEGGGVFGQHELYAEEAEYSELLEWRLSYQAHRAGSSRGAKGEIGEGISVAKVRMLPVAQLAIHLRQLRRGHSRQLSHELSRDLSAASLAPPAAAAAPTATRRTHVHVGAGRLGLGLVVPALARGCVGGTLVLQQRPSEAWAALSAGAIARFSVNGKTVCSLRVVRGASVEELNAALGRVDADGLSGVLLLSEEPPMLDVLGNLATSLSCSLGPAMASGLQPLVAALHRAGRASAAVGGRLRLYAAENDHEAVGKLAGSEGVCGLLNVIPLLVDRVCTDRTIKRLPAAAAATGEATATAAADEVSVDTSAEPWDGEIVVMVRDDDDDDEAGEAAGEAEEARRRLLAVPPFAGEGVRWPKSAAEAHFLHRRKILTVNGTHTTLAFLTLAYHEPPPHTGLPLGEYELLRAVVDEADGEEIDEFDERALQVEDTHRMAWCWAVARQLVLLFESEVEVARAAFGCDGADAAASDAALADALLTGARVAIRRLGKGGDTTKRVLGGGVVNRFQTRLKPIAAFLETSGGKSAAGGIKAGTTSQWVRGALPRLLMRRAKLTETTMRLAVLGLAADAERFTVDNRAADIQSPMGKPPATPPGVAAAAAAASAALPRSLADKFAG